MKLNYDVNYLLLTATAIFAAIGLLLFGFGAMILVRAFAEPYDAPRWAFGLVAGVSVSAGAGSLVMARALWQARSAPP
jgi:hypothetical protein